MTSSPKYKDQHTFEQRLAESSQIRSKHADRLPVICERAQRSLTVAEIDKHKFLVPADLPLSQFVFVVRKRIKLTSEQALFLFIHTTPQPSPNLISSMLQIKTEYVIPRQTATMSEIYQQYKDEDGFLYIVYSGENTFGNDSLLKPF